VSYVDKDGRAAQCVAYRSKHSLTIHNVRLGVYKNYKFNIIEC
jgi:hypothetical protein